MTTVEKCASYSGRIDYRQYFQNTIYLSQTRAAWGVLERPFRVLIG